jgi:hypothetical protein
MAETFAPKLASSTSASPAGSSASLNLAPECPQVRLLWVPTSAGDRAQVRWGKGAQTALTTDMQLCGGAVPECFTKQDADTLAVIGTGTLYATCGHGE